MCRGWLFSIAVMVWMWGVASSGWSQLVVPVGSPTVVEAEARILESLSQRVDVDWKDDTVEQVVDFLRGKGLPVVLDRRALEDAGIDQGQRTSCQLVLSGIQLRSALRLFLHPLELTWLVRDEVLFITTRERAENMLKTCVYDVSHLVGESHEAEPLVEAIMSNIEPVTWADTQGGPGTISAIPLHGRTVLVVSQTEEIHEELGWFLAALRRIAPDAARPRQEIPSARIPRSRLPTTGTLTPSSAMRGHGMTRATE